MAMCAIAYKARKASGGSDSTFQFVGPMNSAAHTLHMSLLKDDLPRWFKNVFGERQTGNRLRSYASQFFLPTRAPKIGNKGSEGHLVAVKINSDSYPSEGVRILVGDDEVSDALKLGRLMRMVEDQGKWKKEIAKYRKGTSKVLIQRTQLPNTKNKCGATVRPNGLSTVRKYGNLKAAIPISNNYVRDCLKSFKQHGMEIDYDRLLQEAEPVDFTREAKTDYLVLRLSCVFLDDLDKDTTTKVAIIKRSEEDHDQNAGIDSVIVSSELVDTYAFLKSGNGLLINRYQPFTEKLGAHFGAFEIDRQAWVRRLRQQIDKKTGKMRYYAFYVHKAHLQDRRLPVTFNLQGTVPNDVFQGFWTYRDARMKVTSEELIVDKLVLANLAGKTFAHKDLY